MRTMILGLLLSLLPGPASAFGQEASLHPTVEVADALKALTDPDSVNAPQLLNELADNFIAEIPNAFSNPETAHFLLDALYGFSVENGSVTGNFYLSDPLGTFRERMGLLSKNPTEEPWSKSMLRVFQAFDRAGGRLGLKCETPGRLGLHTRMVSLIEDERSGQLSGARLRAQWTDMIKAITVARQAILETKGK